MKAEEMFKELGFEKRILPDSNYAYERDYGSRKQQIVFRDSKYFARETEYMVDDDDDYGYEDAMYITMAIDKAIQQQILELGW